MQNYLTLQPTPSGKDLDFRSATKPFERRLIDEALRLADGNKALAARMLHLKRTTLVAKLRGRWRGKNDHEHHSQSTPDQKECAVPATIGRECQAKNFIAVLE
jgi:hypothetical protein